MKKASLDSTFLCKSKKKDGDDGNLSGDKNVMEDGSTSMYWQSIGQIYAWVKFLCVIFFLRILRIRRALWKICTSKKKKIK